MFGCKCSWFFINSLFRSRYHYSRGTKLQSLRKKPIVPQLTALTVVALRIGEMKGVIADDEVELYRQALAKTVDVTQAILDKEGED